MSNDLPKGMYKGEDGVERFWDGTQWLEPQATSKRGSISRKAIGLGLAAVIVSAGSIYGVTTFIQQQNEAAAAEAQLKLELETQARFEERAAEVKSFFRQVVEGCPASSGVEFDEENLTIDGKGEEDLSGADYFKVICLIEDSGMPPAVKSRWDNTNSLQGLLEDEWEVLDGDAAISASWSYHPDSGPSVAMQLESAFLEEFDFEKHKDLVPATEEAQEDSSGA